MKNNPEKEISAKPKKLEKQPRLEHENLKELSKTSRR